MYLFDTNIFLEVLLGQERAQACQNALAMADSSRQGWITSFSLHAIEALTGKPRQVAVLRKFHAFLEENPFMSVYVTTLAEECQIAALVGKTRLDFDDALQYFVAKKLNASMVTLDRDFNKIRDIEILNP